MPENIPKRGDFISYYFDSQEGREQRGRRPALVVSNDSFNELTGIIFVCPITSTIKSYPFHIPIPEGNRVSGVIMVDQIKAVDYKKRKSTFLAVAPDSLLTEISGIVSRIIN